MKLGLGIKTALTQTLTPQQIQYLKLLQLPIMQLEAQVRQEIEMNPMIEEDGMDFDDLGLEILDEETDKVDPEDLDNMKYDEHGVIDSNDYQLQSEYIDDKAEPFEFQKMVMDADPETSFDPNRPASDDDDYEPFQIKDQANFNQELIDQLRLLPLTDEEFILGEHIIGNIDDDGYLRRDEQEIIDEVNKNIAEINFKTFYSETYSNNGESTLNGSGFHNPAKLFVLSKNSNQLLETGQKYVNGDFNIDVDTFENEITKKVSVEKKLKEVNREDFERILSYINYLEPAGIGSRTIQDCLLAQLKIKTRLNAAQKLAKEILENHYDAFTKKHYHVIIKNLEVSEDYLKEAFDEIRRLNPKPGGLDYQNEYNSIIPDFVISHDDETGELIINVNDTRIPELKLSRAYENMKKEAAYKQFNKDTKDWIRQKREDAKFLMQALKQRKATMLKVMTAIAHIQEEFFFFGPSGLKPLIYKNIADETGLDISTVCRIVNGKYVQTTFGTFELKYFFSESLPSDDGEDVSTKVIKEALKKIIEDESKGKPYSDDKLSKELKTLGYNVARRTVAKYREQMNIPVARLRKELV